MGRNPIDPAAGPMPAATRQLKVMEELRRAGGKKIAAKFTPDKLAHLHTIMSRCDLDQQQAVLLAVEEFAKSLGGSRRKRGA